MKASDLMIGDWIMYGDKPVQVLQLTVDKVYRGFFPIPLTPEILEKNGFAEDDNDDCWGDANCFFIPNYADKNIISWETHIEPTNGRGDFSGNLTYVHELQHALRLCGIDKEITL